MLPLLGLIFTGIQAAGSVVSHVDRTNRANQRKKFIDMAFDNEVQDVRRALSRINDTTSSVMSQRGVGSVTTEAFVFENAYNAQKDIDNLNIRRSQEIQNVNDDIASSESELVSNLFGGFAKIATGLSGSNAFGATQQFGFKRTAGY